VRQFEAFAVGREKHGVLAHDVAAPDRVEADLFLGAFADEPGAAVDGRVLQVQP